MHIEEVQKEAWGTAEEKGFHDARNNDAPTVLALIHSEVSEALEAHREEELGEFGEELADIIIRVGDLAESENVDLQSEVERKMEKNREREKPHGKNY